MKDWRSSSFAGDSLAIVFGMLCEGSEFLSLPASTVWDGCEDPTSQIHFGTAASSCPLTSSCFSQQHTNKIPAFDLIDLVEDPEYQHHL